jgi:hypothetical protein
MVTLARLEQNANAKSPIVVTLLGIVTLKGGPFTPENAYSPIVVTGRPLIVSGMDASPPPPLARNLVIVNVPLALVW